MGREETIRATAFEQPADSGAVLPKYVALARAIEGCILGGEYRLGDRLPSERSLAEEHSVTVMTVRQALGTLAEKGLISRQQGRGTFVTLPDSAPVPKSEAERTRPLCLLGLSKRASGLQHPVNWRVRLLRFQGIVDTAFRLGLTIETEPSFDLGGRVDQLIATFRRNSGLILHDELLPESVLMGLREAGVPVVAINCYDTLACCSRIQATSREGALAATRHLIQLNHKRIGLIVGEPSRPSMRQRLDGYRDALAIHGRSVDESLVVVEPRGLVEDGAEATTKLLSLPSQPTAIFAASDNRALGVLQAASEAGLAVPDDLAVVGFDDIHEAEEADPPLTTVHNPLYESGAAAVQMLYEQICEGGEGSQVRVMPMKLVIRKSCGGPLSGSGKMEIA